MYVTSGNAEIQPSGHEKKEEIGDFAFSMLTSSIFEKYIRSNRLSLLLRNTQHDQIPFCFVYVYWRNFSSIPDCLHWLLPVAIPSTPSPSCSPSLALVCQLGCLDMQQCFSTTGYGSQECSNESGNFMLPVLCCFVLSSACPLHWTRSECSASACKGVIITNLTATWRRSMHKKKA